MKRLLPSLLVVFATALTSVSMAQDMSGEGFKGTVRITATIPCYLNLQVTKRAVATSSATEALRVLVQANCPWQLMARLASTETTSGALHQVGTAGLPVAMAPGQTVVVPCQVKHFAGEQVLSFEWSGGTALPEGATGVIRPALQLWLEATDPTQRVSSPIQTW
jgi:hypothetical protein